jgi:hypothetical protein
VACWAAACVLSGDGGDLTGVLDGDLVVLGGGVRAERRRQRPRGRAGRRPSVVLGGGVLGAACGGLMGGPEGEEARLFLCVRQRAEVVVFFFEQRSWVERLIFVRYVGISVE